MYSLWGIICIDISFNFILNDNKVMWW